MRGEELIRSVLLLIADALDLAAAALFLCTLAEAWDWWRSRRSGRRDDWDDD